MVRDLDALPPFTQPRIDFAFCPHWNAFRWLGRAQCSRWSRSRWILSRSPGGSATPASLLQRKTPSSSARNPGRCPPSRSSPRAPHARREKRKLGGGKKPSCATPSPSGICGAGARGRPPAAPSPAPLLPLLSPPDVAQPSQPAAGIAFLRSAAASPPRKMKAPLAILLLTSCLCLDGVYSLVCWSCDGVESNWGCWRMQVCSDEDNYCATTYTGAGIGGYSSQSISKGCVPVCPEVGVNIGIAAMSIHCCSSFLCNISGANSIHINHLLLALATLASLFYLFGPRL